MASTVRRKLKPSERLVRWLRPASQTGIVALVCAGALLLGIWPLIANGLHWTVKELHFYHFGVWAVVILIAAFIGIFLTPGDKRQPPDDS